jgi:hypothetical protein
VFEAACSASFSKRDTCKENVWNKGYAYVLDLINTVQMLSKEVTPTHIFINSNRSSLIPSLFSGKECGWPID